MEDIKIIYSDNNEEYILINHFNLKVFKNNNKIGKFNINDNILNIEWDHNVTEYFIKINDNNDDISVYNFINGDYKKICINNEITDLNNNIYYCIINDDIILLKTNNYYNKVYKNKNNIFYDVTNIYDKLIYVKNNSWEELCVINNYTYFIFRQSNINEYGTYEINNNILKINWEKWEPEIFYFVNDIYINDKLIENTEINIIESVSSSFFPEKIEKENTINLSEHICANKELFTEVNTCANKEPFTEVNTCVDKELFTEVNTCVDQEPFTEVNTCVDQELFTEVNTCVDQELFTEVNTCVDQEPFTEVNTCANKEPFTEVNTCVDQELFTEVNTCVDQELFTEVNTCVDQELFIEVNTCSDFNEKTKIEEIYFYHKDWNEYCILNYNINILYKKNNVNELAHIIFNKNILMLKWEKWESEIFYLFDGKYYSSKYIQYVLILNDFNKLLFITDNFKQYKNENIYILNSYNNKVYTDYNYIYDYTITDDILIIDDEYYYKDIKSLYIDIKSINEENIIIAYKTEYQEYIIYKNNIETKILINIFNDSLKTYDNTKKGIYNVDNNILTIYWDNFVCEKYILYNSIYYDINLYYLNNKEISIINDNENSLYKINIIENYLYNDLYKIRYIQNNKIFILNNNNNLKTYYLKIINNDLCEINLSEMKENNFNEFISLQNCLNINIILIEDKLLNNFFINDNLNYNIYRIYNKDLSCLSNFELYKYFIINYTKENRIFSIDSFLKKTNLDYNYLNNYIDNNNIDIGNYEFAIIHWNKYNIINDIFLSNKNIEIIYILINKFYENSLYIINLDDNNYLENIIDTIPKTSCIIININFCNSINQNIITYINTLKEYFINIILIKSYNISNYEIMYYIYNKIILNNINIFIDNLFDQYIDENINNYIEKKINNLTLSKIIYINKNINYIEDVIINFQNIIMNKDFNLFFIENDKKILIENTFNKLFIESLDYCNNIIDIIYIIIFYYLINYKKYKMFESNIIFNFNIMEKIFVENIYENIVFIPK